MSSCFYTNVPVVCSILRQRNKSELVREINNHLELRNELK